MDQGAVMSGGVGSKKVWMIQLSRHRVTVGWKRWVGSIHPHSGYGPIGFCRDM